MTRRRSLDGEDRILWDKVTRTIRPIRGRSHETRVEAELKADALAADPPVPMPKAPPPPMSGQKPMDPFLPPWRPRDDRSGPRIAAAGELDEPTRRKITKGRLPLEGRVDLHGLTQDEALALLRGFLATARHRGLRTVIVITGKGSSPASDGILKRMVPVWLRQGELGEHVTGLAEADRIHGGEGALYVRLKKRSDRHDPERS